MRNFNVLVLHRIFDKEPIFFEDISKNSFKFILKTAESNLVTLDQIGSKSFTDQLKVCLTFDDGFETDYTIALPLLIESNAKATFFIVKEYLEKSGHMTQNQLIRLSNAGMQIGSHSYSHPNFLELNGVKQLEELISSKNFLEDLLGKEITAFSFPYGYCDRASIDRVFEAGYKYCCTSRHGFANSNSRLIPRNSINSSQDISKIYQNINPSLITRSYWGLEDFAKSGLKSISPKFYKMVRGIVTRHKSE